MTWVKKEPPTTTLKGQVVEVYKFSKSEPATPWRPGGRYGFRIWRDGKHVMDGKGYDTPALAEEVARKVQALMWPSYRVHVPAALRREMEVPA